MRHLKPYKLFENLLFDQEDSKSPEDVIKYIEEDNSLTDEFKEAILGFINDLPEKYYNKLYANRHIWKKDYKEGRHSFKAGEKTLSHVGISEVGTYWDYSDLPILREYCEKWGLDYDYCGEYKYIIIKKGKDMVRYVIDIGKEYNL